MHFPNVKNFTAIKSIKMPKVVIALWFSFNDNFKRLFIHLFDNDGVLCGLKYVYDRDGDESVEELLDSFIESIHSHYMTAISVVQLRLDVTEGFRQLRENDLVGNRDIDIFLVPEKRFE